MEWGVLCMEGIGRDNALLFHNNCSRGEGSLLLDVFGFADEAVFRLEGGYDALKPLLESGAYPYQKGAP